MYACYQFDTGYNPSAATARQTYAFHKMVVILDIETNGIGSFSPPTQRAVQISWIVLPNGAERNFFIDDVHKISSSPTYPCKHITVDRLRREGVPFDVALRALVADLEGDPVIVAHNARFDVGVLLNECMVRGSTFDISDITIICTMLQMTRHCGQRSGRRTFKWPSLSELHLRIFGKLPSESLHDSVEDCRVLRRCYAACRHEGLFADPRTFPRLARAPSKWVSAFDIARCCDIEQSVVGTSRPVPSENECEVEILPGLYLYGLRRPYNRILFNKRANRSRRLGTHDTILCHAIMCLAEKKSIKYVWTRSTQPIEVDVHWDPIFWQNCVLANMARSRTFGVS